MRILLTGANGFIGSHLLAGLQARGHQVVAAVRDPEALRRRFPNATSIACDFNRDSRPKAWLPRLAGIDAVINCAGVLHDRRGQVMSQIHADTPIALFDACVAAGVRKVIQISAVSAVADVPTAYAQTKRRADEHLLSLPLEATVLRPSLIYGPTSYGGMTTLRSLAASPLVVPLVGDGSASFRPMHVDDLVETVDRVLGTDRQAGRILEPVGPDRLSLRDVIGRLRRWLGLRPARFLALPVPLVRVTARIADLFGGGPMGSASLNQLLAGNAGSQPDGRFAAEIGFQPRTMDDALARQPAGTQDLWHARLALLRPAVRAALAALWLLSGILGWFAPPEAWRDLSAMLDRLSMPVALLANAFCALDVVIGLLVLFRWRPALLAAFQVIVVAGYTIVLSLLVPALWLHPFGPLLKNLPILALIAVWAVLERER
ncbi:NAD(P)H-binding protein [Reyranella sp. CPCC 100927]|uniref:NAD(P)H-binding protein n=1 Tax=Reyranella sp. CPCC 100927 TaxID=2599616 RepID=UPI0011B7B18D|nr:NAD(P)H-binding protein [Reyranella sp. CPCC 100927]TWT14851.1 NAD-dependent epimerase/dehydratase family protein [Reyranella sp. CPCC 100927]